MREHDREEEEEPGRQDRPSGVRGPRYSHPRESTDGSKEPPSGQFQAWSPVQTASEVLSKRWKSVIIWLLGRRNRRFNELASHLPGITPKVLTEQLRELERDGLIERSVIRGGAKHVEYALTSIGESLRPILEQLQQWGRSYIAARSESDGAGGGAAPESRGQGGRPPADGVERIMDRERDLGAAQRADARHPPSSPATGRREASGYHRDDGPSPH